jgi:uncharacterized DUF497 family protein
MKLTWDDDKYERSLLKHKLDFEDAYEFGWDAADIKGTYPSRTGRARFKATGWLGQRMITIVFSLLGTEAYSLVSMRPASRKERDAYAKR